MSALGLFHTAISVLPIGFGLYAFARYGRIDPRTRSGQLYLITMLIGSISALGFITTKGFTPPQVLTLATLGLLFAATLTVRGTWREAGTVQSISLTASYLLLWVFTTTETLTRLPKDDPFATGPDDPALMPVRLALLALFLLAVGLQVRARRVEAVKVK